MQEEIIQIKNKVLDLGDADKPVYDIRGAAYESYNFYHQWVDEKTYQAGMFMELQKKGYIVHREAFFNIYYKGENTFIPRRMDLVVDTPAGSVILELKKLQGINDKERHQLWTYQKLMNCQLGMLINFNPCGKVYTEVWQMDIYSQDNFQRILN